MDSTMDTLVIQIQSSSKSATESINTLVDSLKRLRTELKNVVDESKNLSSLKVNLPSVGVRSSLQKKAPVQPMSREDALAKINVSGDLTPLSTLKKSDGTQLQKYRDTMGSLVVVTKKTKNGIDSFTASVKANNPHIKTFSEKIEGLKGAFSSAQVKMAGLVTGFVALANKIGDFVNQAGAEQEALNLFTVTMGKYAKQGVDWIEKFSEALYLDPVNVMQYMGSFNSLVKGLGVGAEDSYKMSKNLTQLVYDLSSFKNISIESAYEKLMSGVSGELEPLRNVGVAMTEATLQTLAYSLGIDKLVRNMTESEKAQLRYIQIMRSTSEWQTDMGRTIVSPSNALRVMKQQFIQLGRAIGNVFIPIVMLVMPYIIALTQLITALAKRIAEFVSKILGIKIVQDIDYSNLGEISSGITDIGTSADKTTEKLNTMLAPFDDLNVVQNQSKSGGSGSGLGGVGGDLGVPLPEYNALANLNKTFAEGVENAKAKLKSLLPIVIAIGTALALWKIGSTVLNTIDSILNTADILSQITPMDSIKWAKILGGGLSIAIGGVLATIGIGLGWKAIKQALENNGWDKSSLSNYGIATAITIVGGVLLGLGVALVAGLPILLSMLVGGVVALVVSALALLISTIVIYWEDIKTFFSNLWESIKVGASDLWEGVKEIFSQVGAWFNENVIQSVSTFFSNMWEGIKIIFSTVGTWFDTNVIQPIVVAFTPMVKWFGELFGSIWQTIKDIWDNIVGFLAGVVEIIQLIWSIVAPWFEEHIIEPVAEFFTGLWDGIKAGASWLWGGIKTIFNTVSTWFNDTIITPVSKLFSTMWNSLKEGARQSWEGIKTIFSKVAEFFGNVFSKAWEKVKLVFSIGGKIFDGIKEGIVKAFTMVVNAIITGINKVVAIPFNGINKVIKKIKNTEILGIKPFKDKLTTINVPQIPTFEQGGYPTSGDLFFANENGVPEMVGQIGNQTAVANNDQITTSITNALISALNQYDFGGGKAPTTIYIGNRKVYEGYGDYMAEENDRYGTNMIKI